MARAKLATDRLLECVCVCFYVCVFFSEESGRPLKHIAKRSCLPLPLALPTQRVNRTSPRVLAWSHTVKRGAGRGQPLDDEIQDVRVLVNAAGEPPVEVSELAEWGAARKQDPPHILGAPAGMPVAAGHHDEAFNYTKVQGLRQGVATRHGEQDTPRVGLR